MRLTIPVVALAAAVSLAACGATVPVRSAGAAITVTNCGERAQFPSPARRLFVNDGNMIAMTLAIGAVDQVVAVSSLQRDADTLRRHYGDVVDRLNVVAPQYPSSETVIAQRPDVMIAGWNYGYSEETRLTPASLRAQGIAPYVLTESCRQHDDQRRGIVEPWQALHDDLTNLGTITGRTRQAQQVVDDITRRLDALKDAPRPERPPTIFVFDSASDTVFSSGRYGAPQAIIDSAGGRNAIEDVDDSWTRVSWERVAAADPDAFVFVDYPPQTFQQKVGLLESRPGIDRLPAVTEGRFLNLPYALWTSGPLNIDAAEQIRKALERWNLVPESTIVPRFDDRVAGD
ncbi:ABC transporter substrate-binding protein [Planotetraspora kaengkrachanensis]|uniref:Putative iron compound ABC transporter, substrate-binding protein n=1 Tax=Planotetraspora kaengkrachanensis TaxID=575193 RepID=A0A8J3PWS9_9ACTN|nr:ABC transporter substrate-binding protein [Planotetraspora kaengkrachanensis]GIG82532.1 putative iron compound ABC transporter, substrate-binding protein [Planotetraspora kaengkrachanensis]